MRFDVDLHFDGGLVRVVGCGVECGGRAEEEEVGG